MKRPYSSMMRNVPRTSRPHVLEPSSPQRRALVDNPTTRQETTTISSGRRALLSMQIAPSRLVAKGFRLPRQEILRCSPAHLRAQQPQQQAHHTTAASPGPLFAVRLTTLDVILTRVAAALPINFLEFQPLRDVGTANAISRGTEQDGSEFTSDSTSQVSTLE